MDKLNLLALDTFNVINYTYLNDSDRKLLMMLYQPIVGSASINLYFNLWTFLDESSVIAGSFTHKELINKMGVTLKEIMDSREKLEAVGLLKVYLKKGEINEYLYELYAPLQAKDYFSNPLLAGALHTSLGTVTYTKTKNYFKIPRINKKDYEDITVKFDDVFMSSNMYVDDVTEIKRKNYLEVGINSELDIEDVLNSIPELMLNHTRVSEQIKELIIKLSFVYNFDANQTKEVIKQAINDKHNIDKDKLKENYKNLYSFENNVKLPSIIFKTQPEYLRKEINDASNKSKQIYRFENMSPYAYICSKSKTSKPTKNELNILETLLVDMNLKPGVVNVLIDYVLKINDNKLNKNFIVEIASTWKRCNIETVEEAMEKSKEDFQKKQNTVKQKSQKIIVKEEKPDWFDKDIEEQEDLEKQKKLEEMLSRM